MVMPGRNYSGGSEYRYGFNGQEKSGEVFANSTTAEFWQYDARMGRRWNVDPVYKNSPYEVFGSSPISLSDKNGADTIRITQTNTTQKFKGSSDGHSDALVIRDKRVSNTLIDIKIEPAEGEDVFIYQANNIEIDEDNNTTTTLGTSITLDIKTGILGGNHGIMRGKTLYLDGLWTGVRDNTDRESLSKFMDIAPSFKEYMFGRGYSSMYAQSSAMEVMEAVMPTAVQCGSASLFGWGFRSFSALTPFAAVGHLFKFNTFQSPENAEAWFSTSRRS